MRALAIVVCVPMLAACEREPTPQPEPKQPDPVIVKQEAQRVDHLSADATRGDFKANFGEPFIGFENRGSKMAISQSYSGPSYRVVEVSASSNAGVWTFRGKEGAIPDDPAPFVLTIERGPCRNEFSGETTRFNAWLGTDANPRQWRTCAASAR
ncbi:hypothetical protein [Qipengyuania sphaerica]|uniref:hypothetical protein n=1 Tax=Qipengyuania sphaerica TaxID=2867243 RepID=UPI001C881CE0|nr:hypothetical protein [Qipengyuania sphaerica]MBX7541315.1 hypothetical protein [Qipengyuania sphaerica]